MSTPRISIIIPTLNEEQIIAESLDLIRLKAADRESLEIIVVDCGSEDKTSELARKKGARVFVDPTFFGRRARALNFGAGASRGRIMLFLDTDTELPQGFDNLIRSQLGVPGIIAGAFEFSFRTKNWFLFVLERLNRVRYRIRPRYFGDQGLYMFRGTFTVTGGYPDVPILESAHYCDVLKQYGKLSFIKEPVKTSSRRFTENGMLRVFLQDLLIWLLDLLGFDVNKLASRYWQHNRKLNSGKR